MSELTDILKMPDDQPAQIAEARGLRLEFLAIAFCAETGLKPSECELVQQNVGNEIRFFYRKQEKNSSSTETP